MKITWIGRKKFQQEMTNAAVTFPTVLGQKMAQAVEVGIGRSQQQFKGSRTRALYRIKGGKRVKRKTPRPVTSPPNMLGIWTGQYRKAISGDTFKRGRSWWGEVGPPSHIRYAEAHEFGRGRMPRRPVIEPGMKKAEPKIIRILGSAFKVVMR